MKVGTDWVNMRCPVSQNIKAIQAASLGFVLFGRVDRCVSTAALIVPLNFGIQQQAFAFSATDFRKAGVKKTINHGLDTQPKGQ
jgi:hypothetical protein